MTWLDYLILALIIGSIMLSLFRGLAAEVLSLFSWLMAFWAARSLSPLVAEFMPLPGDGLRLVAAFLLLLVGVWLLAGVLRASLTVMLDAVGLGGVNRFLGAVFGLVRGMLLVTVVMILGGLSNLPQSPGWQNALLVAPFQAVALAAKPWLPDTLAQKMKFT
jgi:membrane protein required for colicin V production